MLNMLNSFTLLLLFKKIRSLLITGVYNVILRVSYSLVFITIFYLTEVGFDFIVNLFIVNFLLDIILLLSFFILFLFFIPKNEIIKIKKYSLLFSIIIFILTLCL